MSLILNEEQQILKESAEKFFAANSPVARMREIRDERDPTGFSKEIWKQMAELGWLGIVFPEEYGGSAMGLGEISVIMVEAGRVLAPEPLLSTVLLGANAVRLSGNKALQDKFLPKVVSGEHLMAFALEETKRFQPYHVHTKAKKTRDGYTISGTKRFVFDAHVADQIIVVARVSDSSSERDGLSLFLMDANSDGIEIQRTTMMDGRNAADIAFDNVAIGNDRVLGDAELLDDVLNQATLGQVAEIIGLMDETFDRTVEYLKEREQFGVKIGTFQALRHRAAEMFAELEFARTLLLDGTNAVDAGRDDVALSVSAAKYQANKAARRIGAEAIQMHGGMGMTDELDIGLYFKRMRAAEVCLGDRSYHLRRFSALQGY